MLYHLYQAYPAQQLDSTGTPTATQYAMVQSTSPYGYSPYPIATPTSPTSESMGTAAGAAEYFMYTGHPQQTTSLLNNSESSNSNAVLIQSEQQPQQQESSKTNDSGSQE